MRRRNNTNFISDPVGRKYAGVVNPMHGTKHANTRELLGRDLRGFRAKWRCTTPLDEVREITDWKVGHSNAIKGVYIRDLYHRNADLIAGMTMRWHVTVNVCFTPRIPRDLDYIVDRTEFEVHCSLNDASPFCDESIAAAMTEMALTAEDDPNKGTFSHVDYILVCRGG